MGSNGYVSFSWPRKVGTVSQKKDVTRFSKLLSYVLRHHPEAAGLELDRQGWADIEVLIAGGNRAKKPLNRA